MLRRFHHLSHFAYQVYPSQINPNSLPIIVIDFELHLNMWTYCGSRSSKFHSSNTYSGVEVHVSDFRPSDGTGRRLADIALDRSKYPSCRPFNYHQIRWWWRNILEILTLNSVSSEHLREFYWWDSKTSSPSQKQGYYWYKSALVLTLWYI